MPALNLQANADLAGQPGQASRSQTATETCVRRTSFGVFDTRPPGRGRGVTGRICHQR